MASELTKRVAVAAVGIPFAVVVVYLGGWVLAGVLAAIAALGALELYRLAERAEIDAFRAIGALAAAAVVLIAAAATPDRSSDWLWGFTVALLLIVSAAAIWLRGVEGRPLRVAALTSF